MLDKDPLDALADEPGHVTVSQLGGYSDSLGMDSMPSSYILCEEAGVRMTRYFSFVKKVNQNG